MKNKIVLALVVGFALVAHAATLNLSIVLTAREVKALTYATALANQERTNRVPSLPALSQSEYAEILMRNQLWHFGNLAIGKERLTLSERYEAATPSKRDQIDAILNP